MQLTVAQLQQVDKLDLGESSWFLVDQERIDLFAKASEDHQWIHTDPERARETPFGGTIAHGYLVLSLLPKLFFEMVEITDAGMLVNYGIDKLRFLSPVPAGSEVRLRARLISGQERSGGALFRVRGDIEIRETGRRALVVDVLFLAQPAGEELISSASSSSSSP